MSIISNMRSSRRSVFFPLALGALVGVSACGTDDDSANEELPTTSPETTVVDVEEDVASDQPDEADSAPEEADTAVDEEGEDEDHDKDHGDEDHDDHSDEDHDDEDHDDEDHDDDHSDDEHGDEDHDDHDHDEGSGGLGAHEHGTAELTIAWIGDEVAVDLISPTFNVFGFEYEPTTDEDLAIETDRTAALIAPGMIAINDEAACSLANPAETAVEREGSHAEITVSWAFTCANPDEIGEVDLSGLFAEFPNFEDIDAQWISDTNQSAAELTPSSAIVTLER